MPERSSAALIGKNANGTSARSFRVTGIAQHWRLTEAEEPESVVTKDKFERALKKVSRRVKR